MADERVDEALEQVRRMQAAVRDRLRFRGFSGRARMAGGFVALAGATVLARLDLPAAPHPHLVGWALVLVLAAGLNYGALLFWMASAGRWRRPAEWLPALESLPPLAVGGVVSLALVGAGQYDLLPGIWMLCYGLVHMAYRRNLPRGVYAVGFFYLAAGAACLLAPGVCFTDPRPMGVVFGLGEIAGGLALRGGAGEETGDDGTHA